MIRIPCATAVLLASIFAASALHAQTVPSTTQAAPASTTQAAPPSTRSAFGILTGIDDSTPEGQKQVQDSLNQASRQLEQKKQQEEERQNLTLSPGLMYLLRGIILLVIVAIAGALVRLFKRKPPADQSQDENASQ